MFKHLRTLLSLHEAYQPANVEVFKDVDIWADSGLEAVDVEVWFDYEPESYTDHPYGSTYARERHSSEVDIDQVNLKMDAKRYNEDGEELEVVKAGTNLMTQPWWDDDWADWLAETIEERLGREREKSARDFFERD